MERERRDSFVIGHHLRSTTKNIEASTEKEAKRAARVNLAEERETNKRVKEKSAFHFISAYFPPKFQNLSLSLSLGSLTLSLSDSEKG